MLETRIKVYDITFYLSNKTHKSRFLSHESLKSKFSKLNCQSSMATSFRIFYPSFAITKASNW